MIFHQAFFMIASDEGFDNKMENNTKLKRVRRGLVEENMRLRKQVICNIIEI